MKPMVILDSAYALDRYLEAETNEDRETWEKIWWKLLQSETDEAFYYGDEPREVKYFDDVDWELLDMQMELAESDDEFFENFDSHFKEDFEECYKDCRAKE